MIVYFDTSAFVPLLVHEATSDSCRQIWREADMVVTTRLLYVESISAVRRAGRAGRISGDSISATVRQLEGLWQQFRIAEIDDELTRSAANAAWQFGLRGYDAVHCAAAAMIEDGQSDVVAASGDESLLAAWRNLGMRTLDSR